MTVMIRSYFANGETNGFYKLNELFEPFEPMNGMIMSDILCGDFEELVTVSDESDPEHTYKTIPKQYYFGQWGYSAVDNAIKNALMKGRK